MELEETAKRALGRYSLPFLVKWAAQRAFRRVTARWRALPDFVIIGAQRCGTTSLYNSFTNHGAKTIIYEMFEQLDMSLPDNIIVPVGGAGLLSALIQACMELQELNLIPHIPRFIAVQPNGCHPFVYALRKALTPDQVYSQPWENMNTCISSLATDVPFDYALFYHLQRQMGEGEKVTGVTVSDEEVLDAQRELAKKEGLFVEPASATTVAALAKITNDGIVLGDNACIILTGNGLLDFDQAVQNMVPPPAYDVDINIEKIVQPYFS